MKPVGLLTWIVVLGCGLYAPLSSAAGAPPLANLTGSITTTLQAVDVLVGNIKLGNAGTLNDVVPLKGLPVIGSTSVSDAFLVLEAVPALKQPLPGLGALDKVIESIPQPH
jgi:hypothetical protein